MLNVVFFNSLKKDALEVSFARVADNIVSLTGAPATVGGFTLSRIGKDDKWNYADYTTVYRVVDDTVFYSNDGSVYVAPTKEVKGVITWNDNDNEDGIRPKTVTVKCGSQSKTISAANEWKYDFGTVDVDEEVSISVEGISEDYDILVHDLDVVASYETIAFAREAKVADMNATQQSIIDNGVEVELSTGVERFTLTLHDQSSLEALAVAAANGQPQIPWHNANEDEQCKFYSNEDMNKIIAAGQAFITYHVTYFRDLRIYIRSLNSKSDIAAVTYGMEIPAKYQSEVLKALLAAN